MTSGTFLVGWGPRLVALYGGTNAEGRKLNAKYLINWEALKRAKAAGYATYDLWGLPNEGITYFKQGWGGRQVDYVGAWDLVIDPLGARMFETRGPGTSDDRAPAAAAVGRRLAGDGANVPSEAA